MAIATPQLNDDGLHPESIRVSLAGPLEQLKYPAMCPRCTAPATAPLQITKVFSYNDQDDGAGWKYRIAQARPLFCAACLQRHESEAAHVTSAEKLHSVIFTELAVPGFGTLALGLFFLKEAGSNIVRHPGADWPIAILIGVLLLIGVQCLRAAWSNNAYRRIAKATETSLAFDFGDDPSNYFQTVARTYALRSPEYAAALATLNSDRSKVLRGPAQRRTEMQRTVVTGAIILLVVLAAWWFSKL